MGTTEDEMDMCQVEDDLSQMSLIFSCHMLMDTNTSIDIEGTVMLLNVCKKSTILVVAVSWCGHVSNMVVGQLLYM